jgi:hypothetical protein
MRKLAAFLAARLDATRNVVYTYDRSDVSAPMGAHIAFGV